MRYTKQENKFLVDLTGSGIVNSNFFKVELINEKSNAWGPSRVSGLIDEGVAVRVVADEKSLYEFYGPSCEYSYTPDLIDNAISNVILHVEADLKRKGIVIGPSLHIAIGMYQDKKRDKVEIYKIEDLTEEMLNKD